IHTRRVKQTHLRPHADFIAKNLVMLRKRSEQDPETKKTIKKLAKHIEENARTITGIGVAQLEALEQMRQIMLVLVEEERRHIDYIFSPKKKTRWQKLLRK